MSTARSVTPSAVVEDLTAALTHGDRGADPPVDAIKHQAKTVTVGISRSDESLLQVRLVGAVLAAGAARRPAQLPGAADPGRSSTPRWSRCLGYTRYRIEGRVEDEHTPASVVVIDRGGISRELVSRTDTQPELVGTKHRVATQRLVTVARGRR